MIEQLYFSSLRPEAAPLRIAVLLDGFQVIPAFGAVLDHLLQAPFADLVLIVLPDAASVAPPSPPALYRLYEKFDRRMNAGAAAAFQPVDYSKLAHLPRISIPLTDGTADFPREAIEQMKGHNLDVIIRLGFHGFLSLDRDLADYANHGVWSYYYGDSDQYGSEPYYFWEMVERNPVCGVTLQRLTRAPESRRVLTKALAPAVTVTSLAQNRVAPYACGQSFVIRKLWELHSHGPDYLEKHTVPALPAKEKTAPYRYPTNAEMLLFLPRLATVARNRISGGDDIARWRLGIRKTGVTFDPGPQGFQWLEPPPGHFHADPFPWRHNQQEWIFFEDYYGGRGRLAAAPLEANGQLGGVQQILERPFHLSYPFLWKQDGELFMIPETGANKTVELYRCTRFPDQWKFERVMFEGSAVDTTVLAKDGRLWFFLSLLDRPAAAQLFLFSAPTLFDKWTYHPANPISLDIRTARCGGAFFEQDGRLIRTAQDSIRRYGYALRFLEVERLNEREYQEREFANLMPHQFDGKLLGVHTFNRSETIEIIDGQRREPKENLS